jgi:hypothetical protein
VAIPLILSALVGALLGRFCNVLALLLTCILVLFIFIVRFAYAEYSLVRSLFEYAVLTTSLQIGYFLGLFFEGRRRDGQVPPIYSKSRGLRKS